MKMNDLHKVKCMQKSGILSGSGKDSRLEGLTIQISYTKNSLRFKDVPIESIVMICLSNVHPEKSSLQDKKLT